MGLHGVRWWWWRLYLDKEKAEGEGRGLLDLGTTLVGPEHSTGGTSASESPDEQGLRQGLGRGTGGRPSIP